MKESDVRELIEELKYRKKVREQSLIRIKKNPLVSDRTTTADAVPQAHIQELEFVIGRLEAILTS